MKDLFTPSCFCVVTTGVLACACTLTLIVVDHWSSTHAVALFFVVFQLCLIGTVLEQQVLIFKLCNFNNLREICRWFCCHNNYGLFLGIWCLLPSRKLTYLCWNEPNNLLSLNYLWLGHWIWKLMQMWDFKLIIELFSTTRFLLTDHAKSLHILHDGFEFHDLNTNYLFISISIMTNNC